MKRGTENSLRYFSFIPRSCVSRVAPKTPVSFPIRPVALIVQSTATAPPSAIAIGWGMQSGKL